MTPSRRTALTAAAAAATLVSGLALLPTVAAADEGGTPRSTTRSAKLVGLLTGGSELVAFRASSPGEVRSLGPVSLSGTDTRLVGIDWRVQDGSVYGVGDKGGVYRLAIGEGSVTTTRVSSLTVELDPAADRFGVDFNPAADRLRVISSTGQNLRHNVNLGGSTIADTPLTSPGVTPALVAVAAGYTNNDLASATGTTLFDVTSVGSVAVQSPANSGQLASVGSLGVGPTATAAFDIRTQVEEGRVLNTGFAALGAGGDRRLFAVDALSGRATLLGALGAAVDDLTVVG